jgi:hypothetical protein
MVVNEPKPSHDNDSSSGSFSNPFSHKDEHGISNQDAQWEPINQTSTSRTTRQVDGEDLINLPSRTLTNNAYLEEYLEETAEGQISRDVSSSAGKIERYELVTWKINDPENPKNWSKAYKWWCTMCVALTCFVVAFDSAVITSDTITPAKKFGVSNEVSLLSVTVFVIGFGVGW